MIVLSPRAIERLQSHRPSWPVPKLFRLAEDGRVLDDLFAGITINTPSLLCVEDFLDALRWAEAIGRPQGVAGARRRQRRGAVRLDRVNAVDRQPRRRSQRRAPTPPCACASPTFGEGLQKNAASPIAWSPCLPPRGPPMTSAPTARRRRGCGFGAASRSKKATCKRSPRGSIGPMHRPAPAPIDAPRRSAGSPLHSRHNSDVNRPHSSRPGTAVRGRENNWDGLHHAHGHRDCRVCFWASSPDVRWRTRFPSPRASRRSPFSPPAPKRRAPRGCRCRRASTRWSSAIFRPRPCPAPSASTARRPPASTSNRSIRAAATSRAPIRRSCKPSARVSRTRSKSCAMTAASSRARRTRRRRRRRCCRTWRKCPAAPLPRTASRRNRARRPPPTGRKSSRSSPRAGPKPTARPSTPR